LSALLQRIDRIVFRAAIRSSEFISNLTSADTSKNTGFKVRVETALPSESTEWQYRDREPLATGWWRRECPPQSKYYHAISISYKSASVRTRKFTRELMQDFSGQGRTPAMSS
jgi:hypothetical protein